MDYNKQYADVAELVDALASGASASNGVKVQVLSSAPEFGKLRKYRSYGRFFHYVLIPVVMNVSAALGAWRQVENSSK